ncbi:MAG: FliJ family protein [Zoogloea sp.]|nr:FliJ family protein [Zoogloea sp.]
MFVPDAMAAIYCCRDAGGHQICGDILPPQCYNQAYKEIGPQGTIRRQVEAPLSPEQRARRDADERAVREAQARVRADQRRDQALLETYASLADLDARRDRALAGVNSELQQARARLDQLVQYRRRLDAEVAGYAGRPLPQRLSSAIHDADGELASQRGLVDAKQRDLDAVRAHYQEDRQRYLTLTGQAPAASGR